MRVLINTSHVTGSSYRAVRRMHCRRSKNDVLSPVCFHYYIISPTKCQLCLKDITLIMLRQCV